jgi:Ca2+-binding EF-hand superfamily protein
MLWCCTLQCLFARFDKNRDGLISYGEFVSVSMNALF